MGIRTIGDLPVGDEADLTDGSLLPIRNDSLVDRRYSLAQVRNRIRNAAEVLTGAGQTVNTGTVDLITYTPPDNSTMHIDVTIVARSATNGDGKGTRRASVFKTISGTLSLVASGEFIDNSDASLTSVSTAWTISGDDLILRITGIASHTVDWFAEAVVYIVD